MNAAATALDWAAANASPLTDGASALLLMREDKAKAEAEGQTGESAFTRSRERREE